MSGWANPERPVGGQKELQRELAASHKKIQDLLVVIDTAQTALKRAENCVPEDKQSYVFNRSAIWVLGWKDQQASQPLNTGCNEDDEL